MKEKDNDAEFFHEILSKSKLDVPFPDFDDNLMKLIKDRHSKKTSVSRDLKLSWMFFAVGTGFGISAAIILPILQVTILGTHFDNLRLPGLILFSILMTTQIDNISDYYRTQKNRKL
jgi:hypothetical protein